jgi:hypothetical protein
LIGPVEFDRLGSLFAVRCPEDLDLLMRETGGDLGTGQPALAAGQFRAGQARADAAAGDRFAVPAGGDRSG